VEVFRDSGAEGQTFLGAGVVAGGQFSVALNSNPPRKGLASPERTVTDTSGNTSHNQRLVQATPAWAGLWCSDQPILAPAKNQIYL